MSKGAQRFEIFTGKGKRRDWPPEVKASIVAECYAGGERVGAVARRHGLDPSQVYAWRKDLSKQLDDLGLAPPLAEPVSTMFVPAVVEPATRPEPSPARRARRRRRNTAAAVELEIDGVAVKIAHGADASVIAAVIEALKATR
ncbi:MAG: transposase [Novosphingobium sp.]|uniref:IS66-like element accessory protein TnpA n=1 Tax=Novosphingobium sp. TaxID=1874826 RepID=UPI00301788EA